MVYCGDHVDRFDGGDRVGCVDRGDRDDCVDRGDRFVVISHSFVPRFTKAKHTSSLAKGWLTIEGCGGEVVRRVRGGAKVQKPAWQAF